MTRTRFQKIVRIATAALAVLLIAGYAIWRSSAYASGPRIDVFAPVDGSSVSAPTVQVVGQVLRASQLTVNGFPTSVDEKGAFNETLAIFPGVNAITLRAADQFGRSVVTQLSVFGTMQP